MKVSLTSFFVFFVLEKLQSHLYGITHFGDNIEDEWFVVFLLFQITKEVDGLIVRVVDADGEFLLIESADYLPNWANPESCEKKVGFLITDVC